jgi:hypothetical protein
MGNYSSSFFHKGGRTEFLKKRQLEGTRGKVSRVWARLIYNGSSDILQVRLFRLVILKNFRKSFWNLLPSYPIFLFDLSIPLTVFIGVMPKASMIMRTAYGTMEVKPFVSLSK